MHRVHELQTALSLDAYVLACWYATMDTTSRQDGQGNPRIPGPYTCTFLAVVDPPDPALAIAKVSNPANAETIATHLPALAAGLQISQTDLLTLAAPACGSAADAHPRKSQPMVRHHHPGPQPATRPHRTARAQTVPGIADPFAGPALARRCRDTYTELTAAGLSTAQIGYLLTPDQATTVGPDGPTITGYLNDLTAAEKAHDQVQDNTQPVADTLGRRLALLPDLADKTTGVLEAVAIVLGTFTGTSADANGFIELHFASFLDTANAKNKLGPLISVSVTCKPGRPRSWAGANTFSTASPTT